MLVLLSTVYNISGHGGTSFLWSVKSGTRSPYSNRGLIDKASLAAIQEPAAHNQQQGVDRATGRWFLYVASKLLPSVTKDS